MDNVIGQFVKAQMTSPKEKQPRLILDVLLDRKATGKETGGLLQNIWLSPETSGSAWELVKECKLGDMIELKVVIEFRGNRPQVSYIPIAVTVA